MTFEIGGHGEDLANGAGGLPPTRAEPLHDGSHRTADADRPAEAEATPHRDRRTHPRRAFAAQAGERDGGGVMTVGQGDAWRAVAEADLGVHA